MSRYFSKSEIEKRRWPECRFAIPATVTLECPNCKAPIECDVDLDHDACSSDQLAVAVASIDTDFCEDCGKRLCPKCPRTADSDGLLHCPECQEVVPC
jgi:hypothetical protein